ncbi:hypothetical protein LRH25_00040 [Ideonella azotifigens]|uniref:PAS domain-containing protein n=1 Tax=Ideonella azotifigens TaxID=513160 RepID=A0ABP3VNH9_9BURK|nr:hypothetical protein [Ideonella azotifigens]MCD2338733.1 hypothetical protein [Ideonella azotifigens]
MSRSLLKQCLAEAWQRVMDEAYADQMIDSERGLQLYFGHALMAGFKARDMQRRIYVEPVFVGQQGRLRVPDLAICHAGQLIGVVMLRYLPRGAPEVEKDLTTLRSFAGAGRDLLLSQERYLGPGDEVQRLYVLAPEPLLCWAGVYRGPQRRLVEQQAADLGERFVGLHAVTAARRPPVVSMVGHGGVAVPGEADEPVAADAHAGADV